MSELDDLRTKVRNELGEGAAFAREKAAKATLQYGFVRGNWTKLSAIVVPALIVAFLLGYWVG